MSDYGMGATQADHDAAFDQPEPTELEIDSAVTRVIESLDGDDIFEMVGNGSDDFDIEFGDAVREALCTDEGIDDQRSPIEQALLKELRRQILERAEANV